MRRVETVNGRIKEGRFFMACLQSSRLLLEAIYKRTKSSALREAILYMNSRAPFKQQVDCV